MSSNRCLLVICGLYFFIFTCASSIVDGSVPTIDLARLLESKGYSADTPEQLLEATKSRSYPIRHMALELLTQRIKEEAIPVLREALDDPRMEVRWRAAHLLGTLGDKSGLQRMRQDLREFAPNNGRPAPPDPNVTSLSEKKERERKRNLGLSYALRAAKVLAELGDCRGYELAVRMALQGEKSYHKIKAIDALVEIAKINEEILARENKDPASVLCVMAESEKDQRIFSLLTGSVTQLRGNIAIRILQTAMDSPYQSEKMRKLTELRLEKVRAIMKAASNKAND